MAFSGLCRSLSWLAKRTAQYKFGKLNAYNDTCPPTQIKVCLIVERLKQLVGIFGNKLDNFLLEIFTLSSLLNVLIFDWMCLYPLAIIGLAGDTAISNGVGSAVTALVVGSTTCSHNALLVLYQVAIFALVSFHLS